MLIKSSLWASLRESVNFTIKSAVRSIYGVEAARPGKKCKNGQEEEGREA